MTTLILLAQLLTNNIMTQPIPVVVPHFTLPECKPMEIEFNDSTDTSA